MPKIVNNIVLTKKENYERNIKKTYIKTNHMKAKLMNIENVGVVKEFDELKQQQILKNWDNERCFGCNQIEPKRRYFDCANWKDCHQCDQTFCSYWWSLENYLDKQIYLCGGCKSERLRKERRKKIF